MDKIKSYTKIFWHLMQKDLLIMRQTLLRDIFDGIVWATSTIFVTTYIFSSLGISSDYGPCFAIGGVASYGIFFVFDHTANFLADLEGDQIIGNHLVLPLPSWLILIQQACTYALFTSTLTVFIFPVAKIVLLGRLDLSHLSLIKLVPFFILTNFFSAFLSLLVTSFLPGMRSLNVIWPRFLFPIWFFGGSQFSWQAVHNFSPKFSYLCLLNPFLYITEGLRACVLDPTNSLPFYVCAPVALFATLAFAFISIARLKRRLDFV
ncbi:ABC transporter permease [Candidatus Babeliales bacterium]|nr:ABC transporter permease [Candidatus Babeliales bacterium]